MTPTEARALAEWESFPLDRDEVCNALRSLANQVEVLKSELSNIAKARRNDSLYFANDTDFADWAQSRARFAIDRAREAT
jgi:hypothetical protein